MSEVDLSPLNDAPAEQDNSWADGLTREIKEVALRHGRDIFEFTMDVGMANHAISVIQRRARGNNELMRALIVLTNVMNKHATARLAQNNWEDAFKKCKFEIEAIPTIMVQESANRIILPS